MYSRYMCDTHVSHSVGYNLYDTISSTHVICVGDRPTLHMYELQYT